MSRKRSSAFADMITGVFVLSVLALLAYFTIVISGIDLLRGRERVAVTLRFAEVGGLKDHDNVMFRGMKVGTVENIELVDDELRVHIDLDRSVVLHRGYHATVSSLSILGGNYLQLEDGDGEPLDLAATELRGDPPMDWMRDIARIARNLNELTSDGGLRQAVSNIVAMSERANAIVERIERGEGTVGKLLSSDETIYTDLKSAVGEANAMMTDARQMVTDIRTEFDGAKEIVADVKTTFANAAEVSGQLRSENLVGDLKEAIASFRKSCESFDMGDTKSSLNEIAANAQQLVASLSRLADKLEKGEGTLGKLMSDDRVYNEVEGIVRDARQVLDNFRDTTPISSFSSLATGAL